jgi:hypothetical protein
MRLVRSFVAEHSQAQRARHSHAISLGPKCRVRGDKSLSWNAQARVDSLLRMGGGIPER